MIIFLGADHAGFKLKEELKHYLIKLGYKFFDLGNTKFDPDDDYPDFAYRVACEVQKKKGRGILICGSGQGMCIVANKVRGIHAVAVRTAEESRLSREHGDTNVLCLSGRFLNYKNAREIVKTWLETSFSSEARHIRRLKKIKKIEEKEYGR